MFKLSITQCCSKSNVMLVCNLMYYIKKAPHTNGIFRRKKTQLLHESHLHEDCLYKKNEELLRNFLCVRSHTCPPTQHTHTQPLSTFALSLRRLKSFIKKIHSYFFQLSTFHFSLSSRHTDINMLLPECVLKAEGLLPEKCRYFLVFIMCFPPFSPQRFSDWC